MDDLLDAALGAQNFYRCKVETVGLPERFSIGDVCIVENTGSDGDVHLRVVVDAREVQRRRSPRAGSSTTRVSAEDFSNNFEMIGKIDNRERYCEILTALAESLLAKRRELDRYLVRLNLEIAVSARFRNKDDEVLGLARLLIECDGDYIRLYQELGVDISVLFPGKEGEA